jgi:tRNA threonylcarbamoyladenosine biosynthesis protein TsaE
MPGACGIIAGMKIVTDSVEQTLALGRLIGRLAPAGTTIALHGSLGAGKTHLTRGIARGAGVDDPDLVNSPTYVLLNIYPGSKPVYHLDAYRIAGAEDFAAVGFEELVNPGEQGAGLVVVEWAEKIAGLLPGDYLNVVIQLGEADEERVFELVGTGSAAHLERALADAWEKRRGNIGG